MKYPIYILPILIVAIFGYLFFDMEQGEKVSEQNADKALSARAEWDTKVDNQGGVTVKVTPLQLAGEQWRFTVVLETHSGSLDQDPVAVATLFDGKGNAFKPIAWEGPGPGGHHREGVLVFRAIDPVPRSIELRIADVGGVLERMFIWDIP